MKTKVDIQDALGKGKYLGKWDVGAREDISSQTQIDITIASDTNILRFSTDSEISINFDTGATTAIATKDLVIPAGYHEYAVPWDYLIKSSTDTVYFHAKQVTSAATKYLQSVQS